METWLLYASVIICIFCFQNIYVQVKRNGVVLIWYSISNSILSLSYVIGGIVLHNNFTVENATTYEHVWCGISGLLLTLSSIANAGLALALSIELYVSLRLTNPAARQDPRIIRLNIFLAFGMPILAVLSSIIILGIENDRIFTNFDDGGICEIARHGSQNVLLFIFRTLPEYLSIYPSCILSVLALIPVAQKVFENRRLQNSLSIPWAIEKEPESYSLPTRGGPPPNPSIPPNARMLLPRNVLLRMGLWCCLLILFGIPTSIILLKTNIQCLINGIPRLNYLPDVEISYWKRNGNTIHMLLTMALFLLCFGTGAFANEQYCELWTRILSFIFCRYKLKPSKYKTRALEFEIVQPSNRVTPTSTTYTSYVSNTPPTQSTFSDRSNRSYTIEYQNIINAINNNDNDDERTGSSTSPYESIVINEITRPKAAKLSP
ncbi:hypothetical protein C1645_880047 [Glomus cerebriforme]|uniref:G-protein coupled receptors family 1 profile domain-containing protein n=1 Tax=Glomus cerebriforme TaxID=658196 RepID=A0A397SD89_9GLOM|nr:hypothetical protein C1645_880047 [Glomus cerebriforme]